MVSPLSIRVQTIVIYIYSSIMVIICVVFFLATEDYLHKINQSRRMRFRGVYEKEDVNIATVYTLLLRKCFYYYNQGNQFEKLASRGIYEHTRIYKYIWSGLSIAYKGHNMRLGTHYMFSREAVNWINNILSVYRWRLVMIESTSPFSMVLKCIL